VTALLLFALHPLTDVGPAIAQLHAVTLTAVEKSHDLHIHQSDFVEIQADPCRVTRNLYLEFVEILRVQSATQSNDRAVSVEILLDLTSHRDLRVRQQGKKQTRNHGQGFEN